MGGVGTKLASRFSELGVNSVLDLLEYYPRRYIDRTKEVAIADMAVGEEASVFGVVRSVTGRRTRNGRSLVEVRVTDGRSWLDVTFFNQPWRARQLTRDTEAVFFGKLDLYRGTRRMTNPVVDVLGTREQRTGIVVPLYPLSGKVDLSSGQIQKAVGAALAGLEIVDPLERLGVEIGSRASRDWAYRQVHFPDSIATAMSSRRRLAFDEFLRMQLGLVARKRVIEHSKKGIQHQVEGDLVKDFIASLPFALTKGQQSAIDEISVDMSSVAPMHRLLQGDVGSGKTVVALVAMLIAAQGGHQAVLMAPTEVLAEQHFQGLLRMLGIDGDSLVVAPDARNSQASLFDVDVEANEATLTSKLGRLGVALLSNRTSPAERRRLEAGLQDGSIQLVVGTHALLYGDLEFPSLGLVVIDEQHRFGVEQRALLKGRGDEPDVLVMTATPIPRTAGMLIYGDLDLSELRELPPGRTPVETVLLDEPGAETAFSAIEEQIAGGKQAYVVCSLVEGSDKVVARAATEVFDDLASGRLSKLRIGLLHGQMSTESKDAQMRSFRAGDVDVLVATTVIEVGVDVPNATVMVILDAQRFGLSQLHQLRGRVGRGGGESWCFLVADASTTDSQARLKAMVASVDGFALAEKDLEIRGAGEVFGERQAGFSDLKLGKIPRDVDMVVEARGVAERILDLRPDLSESFGLDDEVVAMLGDSVEFLFKS